MILLEVVTLKGKPIGLVAATSKSHIGYAMYNVIKEKRKWGIGLATKIALGRANDITIDPMGRLSGISEMFGLMEIEANQYPVDHEKLFIARDGLKRTFLMTKAAKKMILKAKKVRW